MIPTQSLAMILTHGTDSMGKERKAMIEHVHTAQQSATNFYLQRLKLLICIGQC